MPAARLVVAVATDDGHRFMTRHFGDAAFYDIYHLDDAGYTHVARVENDLDEEDGHADPAKASGVAGLLHPHDVHVAAAPVFGPNLKRIRRRFVCVLCGDGPVATALDLMLARRQELAAELARGAERDVLDWREG